MAAETYLKIAKQTKHMFIQSNDKENEPYINTIIRQLEKNVRYGHSSVISLKYSVTFFMKTISSSMNHFVFHACMTKINEICGHTSKVCVGKRQEKSSRLNYCAPGQRLHWNGPRHDQPGPLNLIRRLHQVRIGRLRRTQNRTRGKFADC